MDTQMPAENKLTIEGKTRVYFQNTITWTRILGIIVLVFSGLLLLASILMFLGGTNFFGLTKTIPGAIEIALLGILQLVIAALYAYVGYCLVQYAHKGKRALQHKDNRLLELAMKYISRYWTIVGVLALIAVIIYAIVFIATLAAGAFMQI